MDIIWKPGQGIDLEAVERMKQHFPRPSEASPVAWFMGEMTYFNWLTDLPVEQYEASDLEFYLYDTGGGVKNFDRFEEWVIWFQYLLPHLSLRIMERNLLCHTLTYFMNLYPDGITEEYPGFRDDVLKVLPHYIMSKELYIDGDLAIDYWWFDDFEGYWQDAFPATMFFCLKYLIPEEIITWVSSFSELQAELLKSEIDVWIVRARRFFQYIALPELLQANKYILNKIAEDGIGGYLEAANIDWWPSLLIFGGYKSSRQLNDYLPQENIDTFLAATKHYDLASKK